MLAEVVLVLVRNCSPRNTAPTLEILSIAWYLASLSNSSANCMDGGGIVPITSCIFVPSGSFRPRAVPSSPDSTASTSDLSTKLLLYKTFLRTHRLALRSSSTISLIASC